MSLHVVKKILAPGKGSEICHLISWLAADASFPKTQGCKFSDFSLISDFFTLTHVKNILLFPRLEQVSYDFMIDSDF